MIPQAFEQKNARLRAAFDDLRRQTPDLGRQRLALSWSNWGFGLEPLAHSVRRLAAHGVRWIELHGNHYGPSLGYRPEETRRLLDSEGVACAGICGMFSRDNDLSSPSGFVRQQAVDYIRRSLAFAHAVGARYLLVVPGAVGRPQPYDASEFDRSVATLRLVADEFAAAGVQAAIEPIRAAEVSFCHTLADAQAYLAAVAHPAIGHLNLDLYHMQVGEAHLGEALLAAGPALVNLHAADSHRGALGTGSLDLDTVLRALYLLRYDRPGCFFTPEPLGPGGDPYPAMHGRPDPALLDRLVATTVATVRQREEALFS